MLFLKYKKGLYSNSTVSEESLLTGMWSDYMYTPEEKIYIIASEELTGNDWVQKVEIVDEIFGNRSSSI